MTIRYTEVRKGSWNGAANDIIQKLKTLKVQEGQVITIDAHNNGPDGDAIMSAFWDDEAIGSGSLNISYEGQNNNYSWDTFYAKASKTVSTKKPEDIISITGSCNSGFQGVMYVFYYSNSSSPTQQINYCKSISSKTWDEAAENLIATLRNEGAKLGQIISIDAHSNTNNGHAQFHAFWNSDLPAQGDLDIKYHSQNNESPWDSHYQWAAKYVDNGSVLVHGITSSINTWDKGTTYVFHETDPISEVKFFIDEGKIAETTPKVLATVKNTNDTSEEQHMTFSYEESVTDSSSYSHEAGVSITVGVEFEAGIPFIAGGKISTSVTTSYSHTWGQTNTVNERGVASVTVTAAPHTKVTCQFRATESTLDVPFLIKLKSKREVTGTWRGVNVWDISSSYSEEPI